MESILKMEWEFLPKERNQHLKRHEYTYNHCRLSICNEMTTPKSCHAMTIQMET